MRTPAQSRRPGARAGPITDDGLRRLLLYGRPDLHAFEHPTILVVEMDDVLSDQPDGLDLIEEKPPPDTLPVADEEGGAAAIDVTSEGSRQKSCPREVG